MTHHSSSCERRALYNSGVRNGAFNCHNCRPGLDKKFQACPSAAADGLCSTGKGFRLSILHTRGRIRGINSRTKGRGLRGSSCSDPWAWSSKARTQINLGAGKDLPPWMEKCLDLIHPFSFTLETGSQK